MSLVDCNLENKSYSERYAEVAVCCLILPCPLMPQAPDMRATTGEGQEASSL